MVGKRRAKHLNKGAAGNGAVVGVQLAHPHFRLVVKQHAIRGEVLAVGNGKVLDNGEQRGLDVKTGDTVLFGKYSGTEVKVDGEELLVMREDDIMAIIEG